MRRIGFTLIAIAVLVCSRISDGAEEQTPAPVYEHLKPMEWIIGEWIAKSETPEGQSTEIVSKWEWGVNKTSIISQFTLRNDGNLVMSGVGVVGWDPEKKQVMGHLFLSGGDGCRST